MSSISRARRLDAACSGGKILRGRREPPPVSPYDRPSADCEALRLGSGGTWISGIVAGAGRLMSSVFKSESPSSSYSYSYSTDGDGDGDDDEGSSFNSREDMDAFSKEPVEARQIERKLEPVKDCNGTSLAVVSKIESKLAIEQLLMQETFSRDEGSRLIQIIKSRVVEVGNDGKQKEPDRIMCNAFASPGAVKYLNLSRKLLEAISYSFSSPHVISPGSSTFQVLTPELRNSAVTEAKKWSEQKRLASGSKADFGCRSCSSNTNALKYDFGGEEGSAIDVAKSYMRSLSPRRSPLLGGTCFEKTPCTRMLLYRDEAPSATPNYSLPSSKSLKRNHPAIGLQDTADEIRKVKLKLADDDSNNCMYKLIDSCKGYSKDEACKISSAADESIHRNPIKLPLESLYESADFSVEHVGDYCAIGNHGVPGEKNDDVNYPVRMGNTMSPVLIDAKAAVTELNSLAVQSSNETSSIATFRSKLNSSVGAACDNPMPNSDDNQDVEEPWQVKEQHGSISDPCAILIPTSMTVEHAGDHSEGLLTSEAQTLPPVKMNSILRNVENGTRLGDVNASSIQLGSGAENNSLNVEQISWAKEIHSVSDPVQQDRIYQTRVEARQPEGSCHMQQEASDSRISAYGPLGGFNKNMSVTLGDERNTTTSCNNDGPAADISNGIRKRAEVETSNVPSPRKTNSTRGRPRGVMKMKSVKNAVLTEGTEPHQPSTSRGRGRKSVPGARRGRGRVKSSVLHI